MLYLLHGIWYIAFVLGKKIKILREPLTSYSNMRGQQWFHEWVNQVWWLEQLMVLILNILYHLYIITNIPIFDDDIILTFEAYMNSFHQHLESNKECNKK